MMIKLKILCQNDNYVKNSLFVKFLFKKLNLKIVKYN